MSKELYKNMERYYETKRKHRKKYYSKSANAQNSNKRLTEQEIQMILEHKIPDSELSEQIGRSLKAIQNARMRYRHKEAYKQIVEENTAENT